MKASGGRTPNLDLVFDDPAVGEPGRDQMLVHGLWELVLLVAVAGVGYMLLGRHAEDVAGGQRALLVAATALGLLAAASAVALRAAAPNLAVGTIAAAAALYVGHGEEAGLLSPLLVVLGVTAAIGAVQGLVVVGLHVPGWAASLGVGMVLLMWANRQAPVEAAIGYDPLPHTYWWFGGFAVTSIAACLIGIVPAIRRNFGRFRPVADAAYRRGTSGALVALAATVGSSVLAGLAGLLMVTSSGRADPAEGLELTALGLGVALLGGTSAFGRRGGVFGTLLAALLMTEVMAYQNLAGETRWPVAAFAAAAIGLGLAVTRLVERYGRPFAGTVAEQAPDREPRRSRADAGGRHWQTSTAASIWAGQDGWGAGERR